MEVRRFLNNGNIVVKSFNTAFDADSYSDPLYQPVSDDYEIPKSTDELFTEEMAALNAEYDKNMSVLANRYNIAIARDGSSETAKVTSIRTEISELDNQYDLDQIAVFEKHYGA